MKQFSYYGMYRGIQLEIVFCAKTKKEAGIILDLSSHMVRTWVSDGEPRDELCIQNPGFKFASFDGGELCYALPKLRRKIMEYDKLTQIIDQHRKICPTYQHTLKRYDK